MTSGDVEWEADSKRNGGLPCRDTDTCPIFERADIVTFHSCCGKHGAHVESDEECQARCTAHPLCTAWVTNSPEIKRPRCYMTSGDVEWEDDSKRNGGLPCRAEDKCAELVAKYPECDDEYEGDMDCAPTEEDIAYYEENCEDGEEEEIPEAPVLCPGMDEVEYCNCSGDCTHNPEFCGCEEAVACCQGSGDGSTDGDEEDVVVENQRLKKANSALLEALKSLNAN